MRRSDLYIKVITVILFIAIAAYLGVYLYISARDPFQTSLAVLYTVEQSVEVTGYAVREEEVIPGGGGAVALEVADGQKVASGDTVATIYNGESALARAGEIRSLELQLQRLEGGRTDGIGAFAAARDQDSVMALSYAVASRDLAELDALSLALTSGLFGLEDGAASQEELDGMRARLDSLKAMTDGAQSVAAPRAGVFYSAPDGFENIAPTQLAGLTPSALETLFGGNPPVRAGVGKLIYGITWYYAAAVPQEDADRLSAGQEIQVRFVRPYRLTVSMTVASVGVSEDGRCAVVFSSKEHMADALPFRYAEAEVVFREYSGIRIPKEAVRLDEENRTFVYLMTGQRAERVYITILTEFGDSYIAEEYIEPKEGEEPVQNEEELLRRERMLREGAVIIVRANDLFDGKVVGG